MFDTAPTEKYERKLMLLNKSFEELAFSLYFQMVNLDTLALLKPI